MLLHVRLDFYGQYVVDADAKVVQSVDVFPTELNYLCATFFDHRGYGMLLSRPDTICLVAIKVNLSRRRPIAIAGVTETK